MKLFISIGQTAVYFYPQYVNENEDKKEEVRSWLLLCSELASHIHILYNYPFVFHVSLTSGTFSEQGRCKELYTCES
jgi:hypothetical protein